MAKSSQDFFRKHTPVMMVFLCGLLMIAFVVADPLMQMGQSFARGPSNAGEVAVSWEGGQLTKGELDSLVYRRQILAGFQQRLMQEGYRAALEEGVVDPQPLVRPLELPTDEDRIREDVVFTKLYADAAAKAGIVVGDETIRDFLRDVGFRKIAPSEMRKIMASLQAGGRSLTIDFVFDLIRDALLARNYINSHAYAFQTATPQQSWSDWLRVKDTVVVEAAAIRAESFLSEVPEPTDEQLNEYFDLYKDEVYSPVLINGVELPSPTPGFAKPRRVVLHYVKAELSTITDELLDTITEEEIAEYYEQNKEQYIRAADLLGDDLLGGDDLGEDLGEELSPEGSDASDEQEPSDSESESSEPASSDEEADQVDQDAPAESDTGAVPTKSIFRLAAFQQDPESDPETDSESPVESGGEAAEEPDDTLDPIEQMFGPGAGEGLEAEETDDTDGGSAGEAPSAADAPEVEYEPLEDVQDDIRRQLAEQKAVEKQKARMADLVAPLRLTYDKYLVAQIDAPEPKDGDEGPGVSAPADLTDLKPMAEKQGLEFAETADLTLLELRESSIGRTFSITKGNARVRGSSLLWRLIFVPDQVEQYEPLVTYDRDGNGYLVVKVEDTPRQEPQLDDMRDEVVQSWKLNEASELALKRAEEIAEQAGPQGLSLKDFLAGESDTVVEETDPFAWFTQLQYSPDSRRIPLRMSSPEPLESIGPDFLNAVFALEPGKLGAALNHDRSVAYAIRISQRSNTRPELRQQFLESASFSDLIYGFGAARQRQVQAALTRDLLGDTPLEWAALDGEAGDEG